MAEEALIKKDRIDSIGGLENPRVRQILENFVEGLPGYVFLMESLKIQGDAEELREILHKIKGTARTCGFDALAQAAADWHDSPDLLTNSLDKSLQQVIYATIHEWQATTDWPDSINT